MSGLRKDKLQPEATDRAITSAAHSSAARLSSSSPALLPGVLKKIGASQSQDWNVRIGSETAQTLAFQNDVVQSTTEKINSVFAGLAEIAPRDVMESMIAAQLIASHNAAMECYRLAMMLDQTPEMQREYLNQANKLSRTHATLLDALNKHRGKGQQKVIVEHVHVHAGGQALVGVVEARGEGIEKREEQPHAKQKANALQPEMPSAHALGRSLPSAINAEWPVSPARREVARGSEG